MKIGIVTTWFERGAAYVSKQYRETLEKDHEVFIYARGGEKYAIGDKKWDDKNVTWGKKIPLHVSTSIDLNDFREWIEKNKLDVVFFNEQQWWDPVILCNKLGIKTGAYVDYYTKETVPFFGLYDFLICNTKRHHSVFEWHPQSFYIPWGTDIKLFKVQNKKIVENNFLTFFHSGGGSLERKGTDLLLKSFTKVIGNAKLIIHSQVDLKKIYPSFKSLIEKLESENRLTIINATVSAPGLYHLGDVYVYPTRLEGIGLTIAEASASGLPLIVPDNPPMNEFVGVENGKLVEIEKCSYRQDGYYWPMCEVNLEQLTSAMQFYVKNIGELDKYKMLARKYAEENLDWDKNSVDLSKIFSNSSVISRSDKSKLIVDVFRFEEKRSNMITKLYRRFPFALKPFSWLWPIIKFFYY